MIRYKGFKGFFIMKKNEEGEWEYLLKHWRRNGDTKFTFSKDEVKYFSDNTIRSGLPWDIFNEVRDAYRSSPLVLYVSIDNKITRVQYYNPEMKPMTKIWYRKNDFLCYAPQKELR